MYWDSILVHIKPLTFENVCHQYRLSLVARCFSGSFVFFFSLNFFYIEYVLRLFAFVENENV